MDPAAVSQFNVEGTLEFSGLLYIPGASVLGGVIVCVVCLCVADVEGEQKGTLRGTRGEEDGQARDWAVRCVEPGQLSPLGSTGLMMSCKRHPIMHAPLICLNDAAISPVPMQSSCCRRHGAI